MTYEIIIKFNMIQQIIEYRIGIFQNLINMAVHYKVIDDTWANDCKTTPHILISNG
jgi:hypothetical protein